MPFIIFAKLDGKEADKMSGQFTGKGKDIKALCRVCVCPTNKSNEAYRDDERKTVSMIKRLVKCNKVDELKKI